MSDEILSQTDIDLLLPSSMEAGPELAQVVAPSPEANPEPEAPAQPPPVIQTVSVNPNPPRSAAAEPDPALMARLEKLEATVGQLAQLEQTVTQSLSALSGNTAQPEQLQALNQQLQSLMEMLQNSLGCNAHATFTCDSCGSNGTVAAPISCTNCGTETSWGWYP